MRGRILLGIGDIEVAIDIVDAVRRKARERVGIREPAVDIGGVARVGYGAVEQHGGESAVIDVDRAGPEIGGEQIAAMHIDAEVQTLIDRAVVGADMRIVDDDGRGGTERAVPADDRAVLSVENEGGREVPLGLLSPRVGVGKGIVTRGSAAIGAPVPSTRNERPVLLLLTQNGPPGGKAMPQAFCRSALVLGATPGWLEIRLVWR